MLESAGYRRKNTAFKTLETMCEELEQLRYASAITEQKKCWELLAQKINRFQTLRNNMQQGVQTDAISNIQQCCIGLHGVEAYRAFSQDMTCHVRYVVSQNNEMAGGHVGVLWELNSFAMKTLSVGAKICITAGQMGENAL